MKLPSLLLALAVCAILAQAGGVSATSVSVPFTECSTDSSILTVTSIYATPIKSPGGLNEIQTTIFFSSEVEVTGGQFHYTKISFNGGYTEQVRDTLQSIMQLPIYEGTQTNQFTPLFGADDGWNNVTFVAYDQNQEEIMCFSFDWFQQQQQQSIMKLGKKKRVYQQDQKFESKKKKMVNNNNKVSAEHQQMASRRFMTSVSSVQPEILQPIGTVYNVNFENSCLDDHATSSMITIESFIATVAGYGFNNTAQYYTLTLGYYTPTTIVAPSNVSSARFSYESQDTLHGLTTNGFGPTTNLFPLGPQSFPLVQGSTGFLQDTYAYAVNGTFIAQYDSELQEQLFCVSFEIDENPNPNPSSSSSMTKKQEHSRPHVHQQ